MTTRSDRFFFVDTSAFYARLDRSDQWHQRAVLGFLELARRNAILVTSNLVVAETHNLAWQRLGFQVARDWLALLADFNVRFQTSEEHQRTEQVLRSPIGPHLSYVDAASIVVMEAVSLSTIFSFDSDFALAGFSLYPGQTSPVRRRQ
ncbi:MAG: PIN domain-containing protein [Chloroflexi bacterium]|nr:PIN domain-containing protein [Chloroflexota bacterium]